MSSTDSSKDRNLLPDVQEILGRSKEERIRRLWQIVYIPNAKADRIMDMLERKLSQPRSSMTDGMTICARSGMGKTSILEAFSRIEKKKIKIRAGEMPFPIFQSPSSPFEGALYTTCLFDMKYAHPEARTIEGKKVKVLRLLKQRKVRMMFFDDIQHLNPATPTQTITCLNVIKNLSIKGKMPLVFVGTEEAEEVIRSDPQTGRRFRVHIINNWSLETPTDSKEFRDFLANIERTLPLRSASNMYNNPALVLKLIQISHGITSEFLEIIRLSAEYVIQNAKSDNEEIITEEALDKIDYIPPSFDLEDLK